MVIASGAVPEPAVLDAPIVTVNDPDWVGVPEMMPVEGLRLSPAGSEPVTE